MVIEYLFPEIANLFGDSANFKYLRKSLPDAEFVETSLNSVPTFAERSVDLIYMGPMSERHQVLAVDRLRPYRNRLAELIENGTHFLMCGNSFEIFGHYMENGSIKTDGLDILDFYTVTDTSDRYNGFFLGDHQGIKITAFNSRFSHSYPGSDCEGFAKVIRGHGINKNCGSEGIVKNNFVGTYLLGPLLVLNPLYTATLLKKLGTDAVPAFYEASMDAYERRLAEFEDRGRKLD